MRNKFKDAKNSPINLGNYKKPSSKASNKSIKPAGNKSGNMEDETNKKFKKKTKSFNFPGM